MGEAGHWGKEDKLFCFRLFTCIYTCFPVERLGSAGGLRGVFGDRGSRGKRLRECGFRLEEFYFLSSFRWSRFSHFVFIESIYITWFPFKCHDTKFP